MKYFKSNYKKGTKYPKGWYGELDFAPPATVLLYNDEKGYCIGQISDVCRKPSIVTENEKEAETALRNPLNVAFEIDGETITRKEDNLVALAELKEYKNAEAVIKKYTPNVMFFSGDLNINVVKETKVTRDEMEKELKKINPKNVDYEYLCGMHEGGHKFVKTEDAEFIDGIEYISKEDADSYLLLQGDEIWSGEKLDKRWGETNG
jgi:hypothetical protein